MSKFRLLFYTRGDKTRAEQAPCTFRRLSLDTMGWQLDCEVNVPTRYMKPGLGWMPIYIYYLKRKGITKWSANGI